MPTSNPTATSRERRPSRIRPRKRLTGPLIAVADASAEQAEQTAGHKGQLQIGVELHRHDRGQRIHVEEVDAIGDAVLHHNAVSLTSKELRWLALELVGKRQARLFVPKFGDGQLAKRSLVVAPLKGLVKAPRRPKSPCDAFKLDVLPGRGKYLMDGFEHLFRTPPQGDEVYAELVEPVEVCIGGIAEGFEPGEYGVTRLPPPLNRENETPRSNPPG